MMSAPSGSEAHGVSTGTLVAALERELRGAGRGGPRVLRVERRPSEYGSSYPIEELDVTLDDGATLALMFKNVGPAAARDGHPVKPALVYDPLREPLMYRDVLAARALGTARCYGVLIEPDTGDHGVLLERVDGLPLCFSGEFDAWIAAARWLARLHALFAGEALARLSGLPLLRYDRDFYRQWVVRAVEYRDSAKAVVWLAERYDRVIERLDALPPTLIHGEFYASNVLTQQTEAGLRICPIDWEMAAIGPGLIDVAALVAGRWTDDQRRRLAAAYSEGMTETGSSCELEDMLEALDYCRLHLAVQLLGWSRDWTPPQEHRQDWLATAVQIAERLRL